MCIVQVRHVFENATELASAPAVQPGQQQDDEEIAQAAASLSILHTEDSAQGILTALYSVAEDQSSEVASICRYLSGCMSL